MKKLIEHLRRRRAAKRRPSGQELVEKTSERKDVAARVHRFAERLLRRHVGDGADDHSRLGESRESVAFGSDRERHLLRESEVEDLRDAECGDDDVRRLQVAMDDSTPVSVGQRGRELEPDLESALDGEPLPRARGGFEVLALDVLEGDVVEPVLLTDLVDVVMFG